MTTQYVLRHFNYSNCDKLLHEWPNVLSNTSHTIVKGGDYD